MSDYPKYVGERGTPERRLVHSAEEEARYAPATVPVGIDPQKISFVDLNAMRGEYSDEEIQAVVDEQSKPRRGRPPKVKE
jgi:hypothetical protein